MLIYNISRTLVNGSTGFVTGYSSHGYPVVTFDDGTPLTIEPVMVPVTDPSDPNKIVAKRTQVPLKLAWAITSHKSQGMTLPCVEVYCGNEFTSGQLYVALSRAKESAGVSLVGFSHWWDSPLGQCCNDSDCYNEDCQLLFSCDPDAAFEMFDIEDFAITEEELTAIDNSVKDFFENQCIDNDESVLVDLDEVLDGLDCSDNLAEPSNDFDCRFFLSCIKLPPNEKRPLVKDINSVIDSLNSPETFPDFTKFFRIQWNRVYVKIRDCVLANKEKKIERKQFTAHFGELHKMLTSENCLQEFASVLGLSTDRLSTRHHCVLTEVLKGINTVLIHFIQQANVPDTASSLSFRSLNNMPSESKGKVRHCMGWAISREREKIRQEFRRHVNAEEPSLRAMTKHDFKKKELLDSLSWSSQHAHQASKFPESLTVTDSRQYKNCGLTIIRDDAYLFCWQWNLRKCACPC